MGKNELLIYGLLIVGYLLFNYFMQQVAKRARERQDQAAQQQEAAPSPIEDVEPRPRVEAIAVPATAARVTAPHALVRYTADLRHAIMVMTVLGPCRALQPYGQDSDK